MYELNIDEERRIHKATETFSLLRVLFASIGFILIVFLTLKAATRDYWAFFAFFTALITCLYVTYVLYEILVIFINAKRFDKTLSALYLNTKNRVEVSVNETIQTLTYNKLKLPSLVLQDVNSKQGRTLYFLSTNIPEIGGQVHIEYIEKYIIKVWQDAEE